MTTFVVMAKYNSEALHKIRTDGYASRLAPMKSTLASLGGTMERVVFLDSTEWDFIGFVEGDENTPFALGSFSTATGIFDRIAIHPTRTAEEMDATVSRAIEWSAPGGA